MPDPSRRATGRLPFADLDRASDEVLNAVPVSLLPKTKAAEQASRHSPSPKLPMVSRGSLLLVHALVMLVFRSYGDAHPGMNAALESRHYLVLQ